MPRAGLYHFVKEMGIKATKYLSETLLTVTISQTGGKGPFSSSLFLPYLFPDRAAHLSHPFLAMLLLSTMVSCYVTFDTETMWLVYVFVRENSIIHCILLLGN